MLDRDSLRARLGARKTQTLEVPEWGGSVTLRELSATERFGLGKTAERIGAEHGMDEGVALVYALALASIVDGDDPVFGEADVAEFTAGDFSVLARIAGEVASINAMSGEDVSGNSEGSQSDASPSA